MVRMKAPCRNWLDFDPYFLRQKCFIWNTLPLQADFHDLLVIIEICKMMFYFVSKHVRHFIGSTKVPGWKPFTVSMGEVQYLVYTVATVITINICPDLLQLSLKVSMMV